MLELIKDFISSSSQKSSEFRFFLQQSENLFEEKVVFLYEIETKPYIFKSFFFLFRLSVRDIKFQ